MNERLIAADNDLARLHSMFQAARNSNVEICNTSMSGMLVIESTPKIHCGCTARVMRLGCTWKYYCSGQISMAVWCMQRHLRNTPRQCLQKSCSKFCPLESVAFVHTWQVTRNTASTMDQTYHNYTSHASSEVFYNLPNALCGCKLLHLHVLARLCCQIQAKYVAFTA